MSDCGASLPLLHLQDETEDEDEEEEEAGDSSGKEGGRPKRKRAARSAKKPKVGPDGVVKSNSSAALAMLAGAAANKGPAAAAAAAAAAAMQQGGMMSEHLLGMFNGTAGGMVGAGGQIDLSKLTAEQQQQLQMLAPAGYEVGRRGQAGAAWLLQQRAISVRRAPPRQRPPGDQHASLEAPGPACEAPTARFSTVFHLLRSPLQPYDPSAPHNQPPILPCSRWEMSGR